MSATREDAGMLAVARVRGAREQDSRIGLQQAAAEQRQREADVARLRADLERMAGDFVLRHTFVRAAAESVLAAETEAGTAARLTALARSHWQADKTRLSAVQMLLERRAEERRVERDRREARDLDEVVSQQWLRQRSRLPRDGRESA
jgi:hypothetical protein